MVRTGLIALSFALFLLGCTKHGGGQNTEIKTDDQKFSYVIGQQIGNGLKAQKLTVDVDILAESIRDVLNGVPSRLTPQEVQQSMARMQQQMMEKQRGASKENKDKGTKFLADNKGKKGVTTTPSGLQYEVMKDGSGPSPKATDTVKVHYRGTLLDGSEFDSSYKRGQPAEFPVTGVIKGWTEALQMMKVGSKWKLYIPSELAYGEQGRPGIPPNSMLTFEVELMAISPPKAGGPPGMKGGLPPGVHPGMKGAPGKKK